MAERLRRAGIDESRRGEALETLERVGYLDDARFAGGRANALAGRGLGDAAIRHDLEGSGVAPEDVAAALAALEPEPVRAAAIVARQGRSARTAAYLARKGFGADAVEAALGGDPPSGRRGSLRRTKLDAYSAGTESEHPFLPA